MSAKRTGLPTAGREVEIHIDPSPFDSVRPWKNGTRFAQGNQRNLGLLQNLMFSFFNRDTEIVACAVAGLLAGLISGRRSTHAPARTEIWPVQRAGRRALRSRSNFLSAVLSEQSESKDLS